MGWEQNKKEYSILVKKLLEKNSFEDTERGRG
jgi:hypothetical protein